MSIFKFRFPPKLACRLRIAKLQHTGLLSKMSQLCVSPEQASFGSVVVIKRSGKDGSSFPLQQDSVLFGRFVSKPHPSPTQMLFPETWSVKFAFSCPRCPRPMPSCPFKSLERLVTVHWRAGARMYWGAWCRLQAAITWDLLDHNDDYHARSRPALT